MLNSWTNVNLFLLLLLHFFQLVIEKFNNQDDDYQNLLNDF